AHPVPAPGGPWNATARGLEHGAGPRSTDKERTGGAVRRYECGGHLPERSGDVLLAGSVELADTVGAAGPLTRCPVHAVGRGRNEGVTERCRCSRATEGTIAAQRGGNISAHGVDRAIGFVNGQKGKVPRGAHQHRLAPGLTAVGGLADRHPRE